MLVPESILPSVSVASITTVGTVTSVSMRINVDWDGLLNDDWDWVSNWNCMVNGNGDWVGYLWKK